MTYRLPFLQILGPHGGDLMQLAGSRLIGVQLKDQDGYQADEAIISFSRKDPYISPPPQGTPYSVRLGWSETEVAVAGVYTFQRVRFSGRPEAGQLMHLICRAGDLTDQLRQIDSEHYDESGGHKTLGDVFRTLFRATGKEVEITSEIDRMPLPGGYALRWNQSPADFATELADGVGAMFKVGGDKLLVVKRGTGKSVSGAALPRVRIDFDLTSDFDVEIEPRFEFRSVGATFFDPRRGTPEARSTETTSGQGREALPHPLPSEDAARNAAASSAQEWGRFSGTGIFTMAGAPQAVAGAPVTCSGFGPGIDDVDWLAASVTHDVKPGVGWVTTIETEKGPGT